MKLDTSHMRYLTKNDFRVLTAFEMGSKNHDVVPTTLVITISGIKNTSAVHRSISTLAKIKLITRVKNASYDGYRLTYHGYDYLALKAMLQRDSICAVGTQIGIGKESDIYTVANSDKETLCLKIHRLGRVSFRQIKNTRDYLGKRKSASWHYLSRLAAQKEYTFMKVLYEHGFSVPTPIDQSRHQVVMSLVDGILLRKLREHDDPERIYNLLMSFALRLANNGLIHCDFNEFNIMVCPYDEEHPESEVVVIDFPQCVSIDHADAKEYFERDINCIRQFFDIKFGYQGKYPKWSDVKREANLDVAADASGNDKKAMKDLERHFRSIELADEGSDPDTDNEQESEKESEEELEEEEESDEEYEEDAEEEEDINILEIPQRAEQQI